MDTNKLVSVNLFVKRTKNKKAVKDTYSDPLPKKKRIITGNDRLWNQTDIASLDESQQIEILNYLLLTKDSSTKDSSTKDSSTKDSSSTAISKLIVNQIANKISSYKSQDIEKGIFDPEKFIHLEAVIQKIVDSGLKCFYCRESMQLLYEYVREPKQWTVERLDNKRGHNCDNIEIACLTCNLRRRTMYHERYIFTKQVKIVKETVASKLGVL